MISITDQAIEKLQVLLKSEAGMTPRSLRVLVKTTGCSGLAYNLEYAYYANREDHIQQFDGFRVCLNRLLDPASREQPIACHHRVGQDAELPQELQHTFRF